MRIVLFIGFLRGLNLLKRVLERGESVIGVFVYEEDAHERTKYAADIESLCQANQIPVKKTRKINNGQAREIETKFAPDVIFCCGWRSLFPDEILTAARYGVVGAHDSLLPRLRGFAPTNWALLLGKDEVGVTLFRMTPGVDRGDIFFQQSISVSPADPLSQITDQIALLAVDLFDKYLDAVSDGTLTAIPQAHEQATYGCARIPEDGEIDWSATSIAIVRLVRAVGPPGPGAFTYYNRSIIKILKATAVDAPFHYEGRIPGRIVNISTGSVDVLSGDGVVRIDEVESDSNGVCAPTEIFKSVRTQLGIRASTEIARLYAIIADLEKSNVQMQERLERLEAEFRRLAIPEHSCRGGQSQ